MADLTLPENSLLAVDANSLAYRAFHALPESFTDPAGRPTGAVYGFASMLVNLLGLAPAGVVLAWDTPGPTFRHRIDPDYKAGRAATPSSFTSQLSEIRRLSRAFGVYQVDDPDFEADDLIATAAASAQGVYDHVVVVTGDRDLFQLVSDRVTVWWTRRGVSDIVEVTPEWIRDRYRISPIQYRELAALRGDTSDNLPGVPGVGEKTAIRLLVDYGSIDGIYAQLDADPTVFTPKLRENLAAHRERLALNLGLTVLSSDAASVPQSSSFRWRPPSPLDVRELFAEYGFGGLTDRALALTRAA